MPRWFGEGPAEFIATVSVERDGGQVIGRPAMHRKNDSNYSREVAIEAPSETARHALKRASQLAPFDQGLTMTAALMLAGEGKIELSRYILHPLTTNPHGGSLAETAAKYHAALEQVGEGNPCFLDGGSRWSDEVEDDGTLEPDDASGTAVSWAR